MLHKNMIYKPFLAVIILISATLIVFWPVSRHDFIYLDDDIYIFENPHFMEGLTSESFCWAFTATRASNWHPLTWISHLLDIELFGLEAGKHHLVSLFLHVANTILLFLILNGMTKALWRSTFTAALFAIHPLHIESVVWAAERKDVLSALFWMLTILAYLLYVKKPRPGRYLLMILFFSLGLTAKPMLVTLPFVLLLLDYWPLGRLVYPVRQLILEKAPLFILSITSSLVTYFVQKEGGSVMTFTKFPFSMRISNALTCYVKYIGKTFWPRHLAIYYPYPEQIPDPWLLIAALLFLIGITLLSVFLITKKPYLAVGWFWYLGTLVPVIGLVQVGGQSMADRYTYIPLIGLFIALVWASHNFTTHLPHGNRWMATFGIIILSSLIAVSHSQVQLWRNSQTIFRHTLKNTEKNWMVEYNLGLLLSRQGEYDESIIHFTAAARIKPEFTQAHINLGNALLRQGRTKEAVQAYLSAMRLSPDDPLPPYNLGIALSDQGKIEEAIIYYRRALELGPTIPKIYNNLATIMIQLGRYREAYDYLSRAIELDPDYEMAHTNMGAILLHEGKLRQAIFHYKQALRINPNSESARMALENATLQLKSQFRSD